MFSGTGRRKIKLFYDYLLLYIQSNCKSVPHFGINCFILSSIPLSFGNSPGFHFRILSAKNSCFGENKHLPWLWKWVIWLRPKYFSISSSPGHILSWKWAATKPLGLGLQGQVSVLTWQLQGPWRCRQAVPSESLCPSDGLSTLDSSFWPCTQCTIQSIGLVLMFLLWPSDPWKVRLHSHFWGKGCLIDWRR